MTWVVLGEVKLGEEASVGALVQDSNPVDWNEGNFARRDSALNDVEGDTAMRAWPCHPPNPAESHRRHDNAPLIVVSHGCPLLASAYRSPLASCRALPLVAHVPGVGERGCERKRAVELMAGSTREG